MRFILIACFCCVCKWASAQEQIQTIHVFVALCDNEFQGIVPVPEKIGNGKDPKRNLYWGAGYGVKSFFKNKTSDWQLISAAPTNHPYILERVIFKHTSRSVYLIADAFDGEQIAVCISQFIKSANGQDTQQVVINSDTLLGGGGAGLVCYVGHDGLMEFDVSVLFQPTVIKKDVIMLACYSQEYFSPYMLKASANPILWTTNLMAPEAYTLKAAIDGWMRNESGTQIKERAAAAYHTYQKCGINGARRLFATGY